jgi:serine/threonine-protein kinase
MELLQRTRSALSGANDVEKPLGSGGMATVFLAKDTRHGRKVAIKVLLPELVAGIGADRFLSEIRISAGLQHPHILPLHDSGQKDGLFYFVMPYVAGETIRDRLDRERRLPIDEAVRLTVAVASALDYAHRQGIVHRDVKPENVLLSDGVPIVADFGIARAMQVAVDDRMTRPGMAMGTPAYMSPEQASGEQLIDARSDVYALGAMLFEMLTGEPPFHAPNAQAVFKRMFTEQPPSALRARDGVPPRIDAAILKSLSKTREHRFATAAEFATELTTGASVAYQAPTIATGAVAEAHPPVYDGPATLAVMPFSNLASDAATEYFCDGMTEEIIGALSRIPGLKVAARTSSFAFKGKIAPVKDVGDALNVALVLEGSVRQAADRLRISCQLVEVRTGYQLWTERFDRQMKDVFEVQDEIAMAIAEALKVRIATPASGVAMQTTHGTRDLAAYHVVLKGRHYWNHRALDKAMESFQEAVALDPNYAQAYCGLADGFSFLSYYGAVAPDVAYQKGRAAAGRAVVCDPTLAESHYSLGLFEFICGWDMDVAGRALRRALELKPRFGQARATYTQWLGSQGRAEEAKLEAAFAVELEPFAPLIHGTVAHAMTFIGEPQRAVEMAAKGLATDENAIACLWVAGIAHTELGAHAQAIAHHARAVELTRRTPLMLALYGHALARAGERHQAMDVLSELTETPALRSVASGLAAWVHAGLGENDAALDQLRVAASKHDPHLLLPLVIPVAGREVRNDVRYQALVDANGLRELREARAAIRLPG